MQVPGMNPLQGGQTASSIGPTQSPTGVPDLILNSPHQRAPTQARPDAAPAQAPFQAPDQPQIQHVQQSLTNALMEMNLPPTPQNLQMAQLLANYGHAVNQHTLGILRHAMAGLSDKSSAAMEAATILLTQDLPVNDKTVAAMKQLMNGQALPQQLQNLPESMQQILQTLQGTARGAETALPNPQQTAAQQTAQQAQQAATAPVSAQQAASSANVQQAAGQTRAAEVETPTVEKSTAQKIEAVNPKVPATETPAENKQQAPVPSQLPAAAAQSAAKQGNQQGLQELYLYLQGQDPEFFTLGKKGQPLAGKMGAEFTQLFQSLQDILRVSAHLNENMQLKNFNHLSIQHQQMMQLTDVLGQHLEAFQQHFQQAFPELAERVGFLIQQDGMDMLSKLAQLLDENQQHLLRLQAGDLPEEQTLNTLRQLMEQVGVQVEKVQTHLLARELLTQNLPVHCIPIMVHAHGEAYPAEIFIQQDYNPEDPDSSPDGERPLKLTLTLETKNLGRVAVDIATLKDNMNLDLKVLQRRVKDAIDGRLEQLQRKLEKQGNYTLDHIGCRVIPDLESRQSMLLPPKYPVRSLRRVEGIV